MKKRSGKPKFLKRRLLLAVLYGYGLHCSELCNLAIADVDLDRMLLHIRLGKSRKDRYGDFTLEVVL